MPFFVKRPIMIEAHQWFSYGNHLAVVPYKSQTKHPLHHCSHCDNQYRDHGWVDTLEGGHIVCPGDWVVTGPRGENYPVKPDIFAETYQEVETPRQMLY